MRYVYSVVRFVPDPARGEFVNVGAIVGSDQTSEFGLRQVENPSRARQIDTRKSSEAVWAFLDRIGRCIDDHERAIESLFPTESGVLDEQWLAGLHTTHQNIVQLSPPTPMVASNAEEALDKVFELLIVDPAHRRFRFQRKNTALAALRAAYARRSVNRGSQLSERVVLRTDRHRERFDFAVTNGKALQLAHAWSFQVPDQETLTEQVRAWGWTVKDARERGGFLELSNSELVVEQGIDIDVVYIPPLPDQPAPALDDARRVFESLGIHAVPIESANDVGDRAHNLLVAAGAGRIDLPPDG